MYVLLFQKRREILKKLLKFFMLFVLSTLRMNLHSELLIVKKVDNVFVPLDASDDKNGNVISDILLKYEWPMCIANDSLSEEDKNDLLSPNKPYAEELFIQEKIREALSDQPHQYSVIFIPTALYELYCIYQACLGNPEELTPFMKAAKETLRVPFKEGFITDLDLTNIINSSETARIIRRKIYDRYTNLNRIFFYNNGSQSAFLYINNIIAKAILYESPELKTSSNSLDLSNKLQNKTNNLAKSLIKKPISLVNLNNLYKGIKGYSADHSDEIYEIITNLKREFEYKSISRVMALEYEARNLNKALLLRGTSFVDLRIGIGEEQKKRLVGSTLYKYDNSKPYSIAFGNSLFSGALADVEACVYSYLTELKLTGIGAPGFLKTTGYALLINKKDYIEHQCHNLFFISSIAPIASIFQLGEFFHSRTKAAILLKNGVATEILGLWVFDEGKTYKGLTDPTGVILITRDPLRHAELFAKYISENGRIIQQGDPSNLTEEERRFAEDVKKSQTEAEEFYKAIRVTKDKFKQKIKSKKPVSFFKKIGTKIKFAFRNIFKRSA